MPAAAHTPAQTPARAAASASDVVLAYHRRSKHALHRYAAGPGAVDWDAQPDPFRHWRGTRRYALPRALAAPGVSWSQLQTRRAPVALDLDALSTLLRLTVGLTAWKSYAGARWSLRVHPSSGNLHPTETWVIAQWIEGLPDGLYHYQAREHALEWRAVRLAAAERPGLWLGFSSVHWREAWKYGERAFRYCQLDLGHVLAALAHAAALLGWRPRLLSLDTGAIARSLGLDRECDYAGVEAEEAAAIVALQTEAAPPLDWDEWSGVPSLLDPQRKLHWPVIDAVAAATRGALPATAHGPRHLVAAEGGRGDTHAQGAAGDAAATQVILGRRSAQAFDGHALMPLQTLRQVLRAMLPQGAPVWDLWPQAPRVHPVLMVHRVAGLRPGLYCLPRQEAARSALQDAMRARFEWQRADTELPLYRLVAARCGNVARTLACHQDIAADSAVTFLFVADFARSLAEAPAAYRHLHWEAGMLGHAATLAAEAAGWRGTGIGCFFDDAAHEVLGLTDEGYQVLYLYAIGQARADPRIQTLPAYA
ncbi:MAG: nitroreductase family protein [Burkholderiales bacterium]|nr:nitroreductase family protein [Burkholderiales bacterium]